MQVPKDKNSFLTQCSEAGVSLPWTEDLEPLRRPLTILGRRADNRIAYQAMEGCDGHADGTPDELTIRRYLRFAKGGPGIIWFEATAVMQEGRANPRQLFIHEGNWEAFARLAEDIKTTCMRENGYEPLIFMQLTHSGRYSKPEGKPAPLVAYRNPVFEGNSQVGDDRIVTDEYLDRVSEKLAGAAKLAQQGGFDGVDIKSCHRYLLCELLSAYTRGGRYGGSLENRTRMLRQTTKAAMELTDKSFIVSSRLNLYDGFNYPYGFGVRENHGIEPDYTEAKWLVRELADSGIQLLNFTMGNPYFNPHVNRPYATGGYNLPEHPMLGVARMLDGIREVAAVIPETPVISSGLSYLGTESGHVAAACIRDGWFAFAGFGRETLANPGIASDLLKNGKINPSSMCLCCGKCTQIMRKPGGTPGCALRDHEIYTPIYQKLVMGK